MENLEKIVVITLFTLLILYATYVLIIKQFMPILKDQIKESKEEKKRKKAIDHKYTKEELIKYANEKLNLVVINDDIKDIVKMIKIQSWEEPDNKKLVKKRFIEEVTDLIYELRYLESYQITAQKYYAFLTEGVSGSVDNVSTVYLKTLIELRIELKKKKYMSDEDKAEYKRREEKLILLIEEEINKNFEKVKEMKHSKNQSALDKADYIIKNGGIR